MSIRSVLSGTAIVSILSVFVGFAIASPGFDVQEVKVNSGSVWILQSGQGERYGRVNTGLQELSSAQSIYQPTRIIQSSEGSFIFASAFARYDMLSASDPVNYLDDPALYKKTPAGVKEVASGGGTLAYLTQNGELWVSRVASGTVSEPAVVAAPEGAPADLTFAAVAVTNRGLVVVYSKIDQTVRSYDAIAENWTSLSDTVSSESSGTFQVTMVGTTWALLDTDSGNMWLAGKAQPALTVGASLLQEPAPNGDFVYASSESGMQSVAIGDATVASVVSAVGVPTKPIWFDGSVYGAWLGEADSGGTLYSSANDQTTPLDYNAETLEETPVPSFQSNNDAAVINDTVSGWAWRLPDGALIPSTQDWSLVDQKTQQTSNSAEETEVSVPKPPVAENDAFGVRPDQVASLPVLLNDHDPNKDVLSIDPSSLEGIDSSFGDVRVADDGQSLVVRTSSSSSGSMTIKYRVTDGTAADGLYSRSASVVLEKKPSSSKAAPQWCDDAVVGCLHKWPRPQVEPGGTVEIPVLDGWVDPESDELFVKSASITSGGGRVGVNGVGHVVYQHGDSGLTEQTTAVISVVVSDVFGKEASKQVSVVVSPDPVVRMTPFVVTTDTDRETTIDIASAVMGTKGELTVTSAQVGDAQRAKATLTLNGGSSMTFTASEPGQYVVALTASDEAGELSSFIRVAVTNAGSSTIATEPVTVLVAPDMDTTVNLFAAAYNPSGSVLMVSDVQEVASDGGSLDADLVTGGNLRVRGNTANTTDGLIGVITYTLSDGTGDTNRSTEGIAYVYQLTETATEPPVAARDIVSVRAGAYSDVDVLANDVGVRGVALTIDPSAFDPECMPGGIVYANNGRVRIIAPDAAGDYLCPYVVSSVGSPSIQGVGEILIHVEPDGANVAPQPPDLEGRVAPGKSVAIPVPLVGIDPDGDVVSIKSVSNSTSGNGFLAINDQLDGLTYTALPNAVGQDQLTYVVEDSQGTQAKGTVRIGIIESEPRIAPVPMVDVIEIVIGGENKATLDPVANDFDPNNEALNLVEGSVVPDTPPGSEAYSTMENAISSIDGNRVSFVAPDSAMTMTYLYQVTNESGSISFGKIIVRVADQVATVYPNVTDTHVTLRERSDLLAGIDVVTDKVSWAAGDPSQLTLSIWGGAPGFTASDRKISGAAPDDGGVVVFALEGTDFSGNAVKTFGLMHIPSIRNVPISLDSNAAKQQVTENSSVTFDMGELVSLPDVGFEIEVDAGTIESANQRPAGECSSAGGTNVTYAAGSGEPWSDGCIVPVRLVGAEDYTNLYVPIEVIPLNPEPVLTTRQITVVPGNSGVQTFDLWQMTSWYGNDDFSSLTYSVKYSGDQFEVTLDGHILTVLAFGASTPGRTESAEIAITNYPNTDPAPLVMVVGESPNDGPLGGSLSKECQANDASCVMGVGEITGSYNPYPDQPLEFAPFGYSTGAPNYSATSNAVACGSVTLRASPTEIVATWSNDPLPESRTCDNITYLVLDDDGRVGRGSLSFLFSGAPGGPGRVTQTGYSSSTATIRIEAGPSGLSNPSVTAYILREGSEQTTCEKRSPSEAITTCVLEGLDAYTGRNPEARHTYKVTAVNEVGESLSSSTVSNVYAYVAPTALTTDIFTRVTPKVDDNATDSFGLVSVTITPLNDPVVRSYEITGGGSTETVTRVLSDFSSFTVDVRARPGVRGSIQVRSVGNAQPPISTGPSGGSTTTWIGRIAAAPTSGEVSARLLGSGGNWGARVSAKSVNRSFSQQTSNVAFVVWKNGTTEPRCRWTSSSNVLTVDATSAPNSFAVTSTDDDFGTQVADLTSRDIQGLADASQYRHKFCYSNGYGFIEKIGSDANALTTLADPEDGRFTYAVSSGPSSGSWLVQLTNGSAPSGLTAQFNGNPNDPNDWRTSIYSTSFGEAPTIYVRYCLIATGSCSSGQRLVQASDSTRTWQMRITGGSLVDSDGSALAQCRIGENLYLGLQGTGLSSNGGRNWRGGEPGQGTAAQFLGSGGWQDMQDLGSNYRIPDDAGSVTRVRFYISGNDGIEPTRGLTGEAEIEFTVNCS
jgi:hypothetical protein